MAGSTTAYGQVKSLVKQQLAEWLGNGARASVRPGGEREAWSSQVREAVAAVRREFPRLMVSPQDQDQLIKELIDEIIGLGPLEPLLLDAQVTEIMINGPTQVYVERQGKVERAPTAFRDTQHLMSIIERLLDSAGVSFTSSEPCVDASLPDGSRINVIVPPLVLNGPTVTIRKKIHPWTMEDFLRLESLSPRASEFLEACIKAKVNLVVSGGTSTGKTTLVSILSSFIPPTERIITIENVAELELPHHEHWIRLVGRAPNLEGKGEVPLRTLVRNALRMRPDRIILGEARGGEALDVVQAMNSGHDGVVTVLHANSPHAALERLQTLMLMSGLELPPQACQLQVARGVDVVIHMGRFADGSRRIESIAQVLDSVEGGFQVEELFAFEVRGFQDNGRLDGELRYTGARAKVVKKFRLHNVAVPAWVAN